MSQDQKTAVRRTTATWWVWAVALPVVVCDQLTKAWAVSSLPPGEEVPVVGELLQWHLVFNPGAAFSLGTSLTPYLTVLVAVVAAAVMWASTQVTSRWWAIALGLLLGGALGNLHDRLLRPPGFAVGHVVDFIALPNFARFNVADSCICVAAALLMWASWKGIHWRESAASDKAGESA